MNKYFGRPHFPGNSTNLDIYFSTNFERTGNSMNLDTNFERPRSPGAKYRVIIYVQTYIIALSD